MEDRAVIEAVFSVAKKIGNRFWGFLRVQFKDETPRAGLDFHARVLRPRKLRETEQGQECRNPSHFPLSF
jgi:hypothetical protein